MAVGAGCREVANPTGRPSASTRADHSPNTAAAEPGAADAAPSHAAAQVQPDAGPTPVATIEPLADDQAAEGSLAGEQEGSPAGEQEEPVATGVARLVADQTVHQFGVMSLHEVRSYTFRFKNTGHAPLQVYDAAANCKCVSHELSHTTLAPGASGTLRLTWKGGDVERDKMTARVRIVTNDPQNEYAEFAAVGRVARELSLRPEQLVAHDVTPGQPVEITAVVGSSQWKAFSIAKITPPVESIRVAAEPLSAAEAQKTGFLGGYRLRVTAPGDMTAEPLDDHLLVVVDGPDQTQRRLRLPLRWRLRRSITVSGSGVDEQGDLHLGVAGDRPIKKRFLLKVSDQQPELRVAEVEVAPDFLKVELEPYRMKSGSGLYRLEVTAPAGQAYAGRGARGEIRLRFHHPRIKQFQANVVLDASI